MGGVVDDFVVDKVKVPMCVKHREKIEKLFGVTVSFGCVATDVDSSEKQWIGLQGESSNRRNAKEYVIALCQPEDKITMTYPAAMETVLSEELLEKIEGQTHAAISLDSNCQISISGFDLAVTLAMSAIEDVIQKYSVEGLVSNREANEPNDENPKKARMEKRLSSEAALRLDTCFERALSQHSDGSCTPKDYEHAPDAVKRVMLQCWSEDCADGQTVEIAKNLYLQQQRHNGQLPGPVLVDPGAEQRGLTVTDGPAGNEGQHSNCVTSLGSQVHQIDLAASGPHTCTSQSGKPLVKTQPVNTGFDLKSFAKQCGYLDKHIDTILAVGPPNMTPKEFLARLYENKSKKTETAAKPSVVFAGPITEKRGSKSEIIVSKNDPTNKVANTCTSSSTSTTSEVVCSQRGMRETVIPYDVCDATASSYWQRLAQDFHEEDNSTNIEELKQRNKQRQDMLKAHFRQDPQLIPDYGLFGTSNVVEGTPTQAAATDPGKTKTGESKQPKKKKWKKNGSGSPSPKLTLPTSKNSGNGVEIIDLTSTECDLDCAMDRDETCLMEVWQPKREDSAEFLGRFEARGPSTQRGLCDKGQRSAGDYAGRGNSSLQCTATSSSQQLRHVVIDGSNVAMSHGNGKSFSCAGIQVCVNYFLSRGHTEVTAFVPQWRQRAPTYQYPMKQQELLEKLKDMGHLVFTPARKVEGKNIVCYDDRYVLKLAEQTDGVIVSNDNYRDLMKENPGWKKMVQERLLMFSFVGDIFMPPDDPLGREGPTLDEFLLKPSALPAWNEPLNRIQSPGPRQRGGKQFYNYKQPWDANRQPNHQQNYQQQQHQPNYNQQHQQNYHQQHPQNYNQQQQQWQRKQKSGPVRLQAETDHLCTLLRSLFPSSDQEAKIRTVLENHPLEKSLNKLSNYVMNICN